MCPEASVIILTAPQIYSLDSVNFLGHTSAITCLLIPDPRNCLNNKYLFSASEDGTIIIWNIKYLSIRLFDRRTGVKEAKYCNHSSPIYVFVPFPVESGEKTRQKIIAISVNNSLSVIDLEDLCCKCVLRGQTSKIYVIHWRPSDDMIAIECENGVYLWHFKLKQLDRVITDDTCDTVLDEYPARVRVSDYELNILNASSKTTVQLLPIRSHDCKYFYSTFDTSASNRIYSHD